MAENSAISWTDATFNPWIGCTKAGPGCDNCYAERDWDLRKHRVVWGAGQARSRTAPSTWKMPKTWNDAHAKFFAAHGRRQRVFCASLADVFDNEVDPQWRADLFELIEKTPNLDWLLLTKRIGNVARMVPEATDLIDYGEGWQSMWGQGVWPENVWLGATIVNQEEADRDIPKLLATPAHVRFLSMEPLLGPVDLCEHLSMWWNGTMHCFEGTGARFNRNPHNQAEKAIDWVIVGGESGPKARPMHPDWARSLRDQCNAAGVAFHFKQHGEWREPLAGEDFDTTMGRAAKPPAFILSGDGTVHCFESSHIIDGRSVIKVGKKAAGRLLDGVTHDAFPEPRE